MGEHNILFFIVCFFGRFGRK